MCNATDGARPVSSCTFAASAIFSSTVRGVPGVANTLNRVPELPNAQEGSSILKESSGSMTSVNDGMRSCSSVDCGSGDCGSGFQEVGVGGACQDADSRFRVVA